MSPLHRPDDLAGILVTDIGGPTGAPCKTDEDCAPSGAPGNEAALCITWNIGVWPGGYCAAPCRTAQNDSNDINRTDCAGDFAVCFGSGFIGTCYAGCTSVNDCRGQYVCAHQLGSRTAFCVSMYSSGCDPMNDPRPSMKTCVGGTRCYNYSPDKSYGECGAICDPIAQDCKPWMAVTFGCVVDLETNDGSGICIHVNEANLEGGPCDLLNDCPTGMMCHDQRCRRYCRAGGSPCALGHVCRDIAVAGRTIKFKADTIGVCVP